MNALKALFQLGLQMVYGSSRVAFDSGVKNVGHSER